MACQGCGRTSSSTRLCCPTCIEFGRTSFFCSQECFTKSWKSHNQLHELLRKKKGLAAECAPCSGEGSNGSVAAVPVESVGLPTVSSSTPPVSKKDDSYMAPLAGGTSMFSNVGGSAASRSTTSQSSASSASANPGGGVFGSLMGQAKTMFGGAGSGGGAEARLPARSGSEMRLRSPHPRQVGPPPIARGRSRSPAPGKKNDKMPKSMRQFGIQLGLWALVAVTITGSFLFYREHEHYAATHNEVVINGPDPPTMSVALEAAEAPAEKEEIAVIEPQAASAPAEPAAPVGELRAQVASLRQTLGRHEQMLRYIMDRYVEKEGSAAGKKLEDIGAPRPEEHDIEVAVANLTKFSLVPRKAANGTGDPSKAAEATAELASRGSALRKQRSDGGNNEMGGLLN